MVLRRNGFNPVAQLRVEMDRLVSDFFGPVAASAASRAGAPVRGFPLLNAWEEGDCLYVEAEVPGLKSENLEIGVVGNELTIRGHRGEQPREGVAYHRQERAVGEFNRALRLPIDVDSAKVEATLTDGVLTIKLPKAESAKPRKIKINPAN